MGVADTVLQQVKTRLIYFYILFLFVVSVPYYISSDNLDKALLKQKQINAIEMYTTIFSMKSYLLVPIINDF